MASWHRPPRTLQVQPSSCHRSWQTTSGEVQSWAKAEPALSVQASLRWTPSFRMAAGPVAAWSRSCSRTRRCWNGGWLAPAWHRWSRAAGRSSSSARPSRRTCLACATWASTKTAWSGSRPTSRRTACGRPSCCYAPTPRQRSWLGCRIASQASCAGCRWPRKGAKGRCSFSGRWMRATTPRRPRCAWWPLS